MLFSEPKIPQCLLPRHLFASPNSFSALQRAENSSIAAQKNDFFNNFVFQCSSASRKFLNPDCSTSPPLPTIVSVLFSEPKIPQCAARPARARGVGVSVLFSEPKIPQFIDYGYTIPQPARFSALQRAENSSMTGSPTPSSKPVAFQCSSASRKFLNSTSAASSSDSADVSVLFSEPKIPQFTPVHRIRYSTDVSVLFSEPKIPQSELAAEIAARLREGFSALQRAENSSIVHTRLHRPRRRRGFSALQRAENSSIVRRRREKVGDVRFQCSSASRKFLNVCVRNAASARPSRFSALQRAENSSIRIKPDQPQPSTMFQCSSASRKFLNRKTQRR